MVPPLHPRKKKVSSKMKYRPSYGLIILASSKSDWGVKLPPFLKKSKPDMYRAESSNVSVEVFYMKR